MLATLVVSGRLGRRRVRPAAAAGLALARRAGARRRAGPRRSRRDDDAALYAANQTVLAYVATGNARVDAVSRAGLDRASAARSSTAPRSSRPSRWRSTSRPTTCRSIPFLYWPVTESQPAPSDAAVAKLNDFLRFGGMILFDTQDADLGGGAGAPRRTAGRCSASPCGSTSRRWSRCRPTTC